MPKLYVMCGISGSGKTYWTEHNFNVAADRTVSTDCIRGELWGDENDQQQPEKVFETAFNRITYYLKAEYNVFFDATNLSARDRKKIIKRYCNLADELICVDFGNDVSRALKNQASRARKVPTEVIERQAKKYKKPSYGEGWDVIMF